MRRSTHIITSISAVLVAALGYLAVAQPFASDVDTGTADQVLNRAQVQRITESVDEGAVVLPAEQPPYLDYLQAVRVEADAAEVHFQERGVFVVVCAGESVDSACDAPTATVFRDEDVNGEPVRVAWVTSPDQDDKVTDKADGVQRAEVEEFWQDVELQLGASPWLHTFS